MTKPQEQELRLLGREEHIRDEQTQVSLSGTSAADHPCLVRAEISPWMYKVVDTPSICLCVYVYITLTKAYKLQVLPVSALPEVWLEP